MTFSKIMKFYQDWIGFEVLLVLGLSLIILSLVFNLIEPIRYFGLSCFFAGVVFTALSLFLLVKQLRL